MYLYDEYLDEFAPKIIQNSKILLTLKPHQLAGVYKAIIMECEPIIKYKDNNNSNNYYEVSTNIGIIGELIGYGKTITALAIIAHVPIDKILINNSSIKTYNTNTNTTNISNTTIVSYIQNIDNINIRNNYINTTLIIVPRGPVYTQWVEIIKKNTTFKVLYLDDIRIIKKLKKPTNANINEIKAFFEKYDLVLIKNTTLKNFYNYMNHETNFIKKWARVMIDEAHDILLSIGDISYLYKWLISASYKNILNMKYCMNPNMYLLRDLLKNESIHMLIKSKDAFIKNSFQLPKMTEIKYICKMSNKLSLIRPFLSRSLIEKLDGSDLQGLIREIGATVISEDGVITKFTENLKNDIYNKKCEKDMINIMHITDEEKLIKNNSIIIIINKLENQLFELTNRLSDIDNKTCPICINNITNPIILKCTHTYCMQCILTWIKNNTKCPECRNIINISEIIYMTDVIEKSIILKSKENTLIDIINNNINGKYLIFSKIENGFSSINNILIKNNISFTELKGTTSKMNNILNNFKNGFMNVILLNTFYAGSGIDISFATDVIIYHSMKEHKIQAIGRAYRVGRTEDLKVHTLLYEEEDEEDNIQ